MNHKISGGFCVLLAGSCVASAFCLGLIGLLALVGGITAGIGLILLVVVAVMLVVTGLLAAYGIALLNVDSPGEIAALRLLRTCPNAVLIPLGILVACLGVWCLLTGVQQVLATGLYPLLNLLWFQGAALCVAAADALLRTIGLPVPTRAAVARRDMPESPIFLESPDDRAAPDSAPHGPG